MSKYNSNAVTPLVFHIENQIEASNKERENLDEGGLKNNISRITIEGNPSPMKIDNLKKSHKKKNNKGKSSQKNAIKARSRTSKVYSK